MSSFVEDFGRFQTANDKMKDVVMEARKIATTTNPVLILGDEGSGRRELALEIFERSTRSHGNLVRMTNRTLPAFETTDTILVENIHQLSEDDQHWLFGVVSKTFSDRAYRGPRWLATGSRDLMMKVRTGDFIVRLFQVFSTHVLMVPSLNERADDILPLAQSKLDTLNSLISQKVTFSKPVIQKLLQVEFTRGIPELFDLVEKGFIACKGSEILPADLGWNDTSSSMERSQVGLTLSEMERRLILQTLEVTNQNRTKAAEMLGISIRTLRNKLSEYREMGIDV